MIDLDFEKMGGLIPVITQDYRDGQVLMLAFMNREAWEKTLSTGVVHYWSRSRGCLWQKGERSGNRQELKEIRIDCDGDSLLLKVDQVGGAACHTGYRSCFFRRLEAGELVADETRVFDPEKKYGD